MGHYFLLLNLLPFLDLKNMILTPVKDFSGKMAPIHQISSF
jgi:hypothetical protein